jgi:O-antigen/teichoic acid export membrane protein
MKKSKALAQNTALQIGGKMLATIFGVLTVVVLTRYLGTTGYGQLTIILSFISIFAVVVDFGLTLTTVQLISEKKADEEKLLGNLLSIRIISAVLFLSLAPVAALLFPYDEVVKIGIAVGAISYLFGTTASMLIGIFQKRLIIGRAVIAELINRALVLVGAFLAPHIGLSLEGIMWLFVIGNAAQLATTLYFSKKFVKLRFQFHLQTWKTIISRSWPIGASIFFNLIYLRGDILFLSLYRSDAEIGIYGAAYKVIDVITVVPVMYMGLILPILVTAWSAKKISTFKQTLQEAFDFFSILAIPLVFGTIALGTPVMKLIAGEAFAESGRVLAILGPAASIVFFGALFGHAIVGVNKQKPMTLGYALVAAITIAGYVLFIPEYGIWAAAWWTLIAEILITIITFIVVWRTSSFLPKMDMVFKALFSSIIMYIAIILLPELHALILVTIGSLIYFVALSALGGPKLKDAKALFLPEKPPIAQP